MVAAREGDADGLPRLFESLRFARGLRSRCGTLEALTVGYQPTTINKTQTHAWSCVARVRQRVLVTGLRGSSLRYPTCCPLVRFSHIALTFSLLREHQRCCAHGNSIRFSSIGENVVLTTKPGSPGKVLVVKPA